MKVNNKRRMVKFLKESKTPISGEDLSKRLEISRTAVWKNIQRLTLEGYTIDTSHSGYLLKKEEDLLLPYEFINDSELYIYKESTASTMDISRDLIKKNRAVTGSVVVAQTQLSGRGKGQEPFISPKGGLYFSLIIFPNCPLSDINLYPMAAIISVKQSLKEYIGLDTKIKWPFESWLGEKKISGILHEYSVKGNRCKWLTIGIGINPDMVIPRRDLLIDIKKRIFSYLEDMNNIPRVYKEALNIKNRNYTFIIEGKQITGQIIDIDRLGTLLLKDNNGIKYGYIGNSTQED